MWLCMWKLTISEEILIRFLDYFNIFALCEQFWKIRILGPLLRQKGSPLGPLFAKNWVPFGSPFYNFWVPLWLGNSVYAVTLNIKRGETKLAIYTELIETYLLNIGGILCRGFKEGDSKLVCILLRRCVIHHLKIVCLLAMLPVCPILHMGSFL